MTYKDNLSMIVEVFLFSKQNTHLFLYYQRFKPEIQFHYRQYQFPHIPNHLSRGCLSNNQVTFQVKVSPCESRKPKCNYFHLYITAAESKVNSIREVIPSDVTTFFSHPNGLEIFINLLHEVEIFTLSFAPYSDYKYV